MGYTLDELSSIAEIRNLQERYCRGIDRADADILRTVYWEDGYDEHGTFDRDDFVDRVTRSRLCRRVRRSDQWQTCS